MNTVARPRQLTAQELRAAEAAAEKFVSWEKHFAWVAKLIEKHS